MKINGKWSSKALEDAMDLVADYALDQIIETLVAVKQPSIDIHEYPECHDRIIEMLPHFSTKQEMLEAIRELTDWYATNLNGMEVIELPLKNLPNDDPLTLQAGTMYIGAVYYYFQQIICTIKASIQIKDFIKISNGSIKVKRRKLILAIEIAIYNNKH